MTELKTLKDFEGNKDFLGDNILRNELKAEAIKWVKELNIPNDENYFGTVEDWIKHFFNLTSKDLK